MIAIDMSTIPAEIFAEFTEATADAYKVRRSPTTMKAASHDMDRIHEEIRVKHGLLDIAVPAIRELRDE